MLGIHAAHLSFSGLTWGQARSMVQTTLVVAVLIVVLAILGIVLALILRKPDHTHGDNKPDHKNVPLDMIIGLARMALHAPDYDSALRQGKAMLAERGFTEFDAKSSAFLIAKKHRAKTESFIDVISGLLKKHYLQFHEFAGVLKHVMDERDWLHARAHGYTVMAANNMNPTDVRQKALTAVKKASPDIEQELLDFPKSIQP